jgi:hypothetical protein
MKTSLEAQCVIPTESIDQQMKKMRKMRKMKKMRKIRKNIKNEKIIKEKKQIDFFYCIK